jgi:hypothetical protein
MSVTDLILVAPESGAFAVTISADMTVTEAVWTLRHARHRYSIPVRDKSTAYQTGDKPLAFGASISAVQIDPDEAESTGREGICAPKLMVAVGEPMSLSAYVDDRGERWSYDIESSLFAVSTEWILHQGPAQLDFEAAAISGRE